LENVSFPLPDGSLSEELRLYCTVTDNVRDSLVFRYLLVGRIARFRWALAAGTAAGILVCAALFAFLLRSAGVAPDGTATPGFLGRVPLELYLAACAGLAVLLYLVFADYLPARPLAYLVWGAWGAVWLCLAVSACMTVAARVRSRTFVKTLLVWILLRAAGRFFRFLARVYRRAGFLWRTLLGLVLLSLPFLALLITDLDRHAFRGIHLFCALLWLGVLALVPAAAANLSRLFRGIRRLSEGDYTDPVDARGMFFDFRTAAGQLNAAAEGMNAAVEERLKSERLKTELITNVSHDIRTPLTSILNGVDLLRRDETLSETSRGYVEMLDRQGQRLKKLTDDLIETSKAASGAVAVSPEPLDLGTLLEQAVGEYSDRLAARGLRPYLAAEPGCTVLADGKLLWRVFDNLLANIAKYAMAGTRVYLSVRRTSDGAGAVFRNISEDELPRDPAELTERFVRGDAARHTEGSGLGLSIAVSLCQLMGGSLSLTTDGDLFLAAVSLPAPPQA
ncbi:MAG: HAMP domain-containing histidine kinase, partial [Oscillospiraceae bacterium]|nr:HAMP domain-containing histidine kinase [Oscillospiraceae bacterium]